MIRTSRRGAPVLTLPRGLSTAGLLLLWTASPALAQPRPSASPSALKAVAPKASDPSKGPQELAFRSPPRRPRLKVDEAEKSFPKKLRDVHSKHEKSDAKALLRALDSADPFEVLVAIRRLERDPTPEAAEAVAVRLNQLQGSTLRRAARRLLEKAWDRRFGPLVAQEFLAGGSGRFEMLELLLEASPSDYLQARRKLGSDRDFLLDLEALESLSASPKTTGAPSPKPRAKPPRSRVDWAKLPERSRRAKQRTWIENLGAFPTLRAKRKLEELSKAPDALVRRSAKTGLELQARAEAAREAWRTKRQDVRKSRQDMRARFEARKAKREAEKKAREKERAARARAREEARAKRRRDQEEAREARRRLLEPPPPPAPTKLPEPATPKPQSPSGSSPQAVGEPASGGILEKLKSGATWIWQSLQSALGSSSS